jgi:hypothetical protein
MHWNVFGLINFDTLRRFGLYSQSALQVGSDLAEPGERAK